MEQITRIAVRLKASRRGKRGKLDESGFVATVADTSSPDLVRITAVNSPKFSHVLGAYVYTPGLIPGRVFEYIPETENNEIPFVEIENSVVALIS